MKHVSISRHCSCGASIALVGPESRRAAIEAAAEVLWAGHEGDGHRPSDREGARKARAKAEGGEVRAQVKL